MALARRPLLRSLPVPLRAARTARALLTALTTLMAIAPPAEACTTFFTRTPAGSVVAKSFDWETREGYVVVNERGRERHKLVPGAGPEVAAWTARFQSVSFTTVGPGFPVSGMNEAGLVIESLVDGSVTPSREPDAARLTGLELVQYGLDRFDTAEGFGGFAERAGFTQLAVPLHFFACDKGGACVVVETRAGAVHVTRGAELGVRALANRPFAVDHESAKVSKIGAFFGFGPGPKGSSGERFATAAHAARGGRVRATGDAFRVLADVGIRRFTAWQLVWNASKGTVTWRMPGVSSAEETLSLASLKGTCSGPPRVRPIGRPGVAQTAFAPWSPADAERAERAVASQLGGKGTRRLASVGAAATHTSTCRVIE